MKADQPAIAPSSTASGTRPPGSPVHHERVKERGVTPDVDVRLREQIAKLKKTVNKDKELTRLRSDVPELVRVINQITAENAELRETLKMQLARRRPPVSAYRFQRRVRYAQTYTAMTGIRE